MCACILAALHRASCITYSQHSDTHCLYTQYINDKQGDRHVALLTVKETLNFAFDSMEGGHHASWLPHHERTADQHELISWMDKRYSKVCICILVFVLILTYVCVLSTCACCTIMIKLTHYYCYYYCYHHCCLSLNM
jgi:hypothetical protein